MSALAIRAATPASQPPRARPPAPHLHVVAPADEFATSAPAARSASPALRLNARGRRLLIALGFAAAVAIGAGAGALVPQSESAPTQVQTVVVQPGENLWVIASEVAAPTQDVREVIDQIRGLNGLEQSVILPGQELVVPVQEHH